MNQRDRLKILMAASAIIALSRQEAKKDHDWVLNREQGNAVCKNCKKVISLENFDEVPSYCNV